MIDDYIAATDTTCPPNPLRRLREPERLARARARSGGCTRDIVHRFYHEQYQLDGGKQDRYVTGSDAMGLTMGIYDTKALPIYQYLHARDTRTTRSRTTSSSPRSAGRSSTTNGSSQRPHRSTRRRTRRSGTPPAIPCWTPTGCRRTSRSTRRRSRAAGPAGPRADRDVRAGCHSAAADQASPAATTASTRCSRSSIRRGPSVR